MAGIQNEWMTSLDWSFILTSRPTGTTTWVAVMMSTVPSLLVS